MIAIGTHRINDGTYSGIKFVNPKSKEEINCFAFAAKFVETSEKPFTEMDEEERASRIKYLWRKLRLIVRTKGFIAQIVHDRTVRKINMHALDTDISMELPSDQEREE